MTLWQDSKESVELAYIQYQNVCIKSYGFSTKMLTDWPYEVLLRTQGNA